MRKKKLSVLFSVLLANAICAVLVLTIPLETTVLKLYGSFAAIVLVGVAAWRFPLRFYFLAMGFVLLASTLGSCLNLYRYVGFYDLFVHYLSGIVLAEGGLIIVQAIKKHCNTASDWLTETLFAVFFSCAGAAFWEIYEFTADQLVGAQMQGSKENTMGDIICGVLGAVTYLLLALLKRRRSNSK